MPRSDRWSVQLEEDGWPVGITPAQKTAITAAVKELLSRPDYTPRALYLIERFPTVKDAIPGALWDYRYATLYRALCTCGAEEVWQLERLR